MIKRLQRVFKKNKTPITNPPALVRNSTVGPDLLFIENSTESADKSSSKSSVEDLDQQILSEIDSLDISPQPQRKKHSSRKNKDPQQDDIADLDSILQSKPKSSPHTSPSTVRHQRPPQPKPILRSKTTDNLPSLAKKPKKHIKFKDEEVSYSSSGEEVASPKSLTQAEKEFAQTLLKPYANFLLDFKEKFPQGWKIRMEEKDEGEIITHWVSLVSEKSSKEETKEMGKSIIKEKFKGFISPNSVRHQEDRRLSQQLSENTLQHRHTQRIKRKGTDYYIRIDLNPNLGIF